MKHSALTDDKLEAAIEPAVEALRPRPILRSFLLNWTAFGGIIGLFSAWGSDRTWPLFQPPLAWLLVVVFGSGLTAAALTSHRVWMLRRYLSRTNDELRGQHEGDWALLTAPGWPGRMIRFGIGVSVVFGVVFGVLFSISPEERLFGSILGTISAMVGMFLVPVLPITFGIRALLVHMIARSVDPDQTLPPGAS